MAPIRCTAEALALPSRWSLKIPLPLGPPQFLRPTSILSSSSSRSIVSRSQPHHIFPSISAVLAIPTTGVSTPALIITRCSAGRAFFHNGGIQRAPDSLGSSGTAGLPPAYFQRSSLPANTIIRFVPQQTAWVVERMGKFDRILQPGLAILIPFLDRIAYVKSLKEAAIEIPSQSAITADNVTLELDGVLYTRVFDAYKACYGVEDAEYAISQLAQTTMRSEIGQLTLDHVLKERASLNINITAAINEAAKAWGVTCLRYEIRDIHAPRPVVDAMHRQVTAERSKRAEILDSEGRRQSAINLAEGRKQAAILASEAVRAEKANRAIGEAEAILRRARATAAAIETVAASIRRSRADAHAAVGLSVAEKYVDAFAKLAHEGTAVVVPSNMGDLGGMIASALSVYGKVGEAQAKANERIRSAVPDIPDGARENGATAADADVLKGLDAPLESDQLKQDVVGAFDDVVGTTKT